MALVAKVMRFLWMNLFWAVSRSEEKDVVYFCFCACIECVSNLWLIRDPWFGARAFWLGKNAFSPIDFFVFHFDIILDDIYQFESNKFLFSFLILFHVKSHHHWNYTKMLIHKRELPFPFILFFFFKFLSEMGFAWIWIWFLIRQKKPMLFL